MKGAPTGWNKLSDAQRADIEAHIEGLTCEPGEYNIPPHGWTCFHCGATLRTIGAARLHFGALPLEDQRPVCVVPARILWPLTQAALEADRAPWPKTTWAVSTDALAALLSHVEATSRPAESGPSSARERSDTGHTNGDSGNTSSLPAWQSIESGDVPSPLLSEEGDGSAVADIALTPKRSSPETEGH